MADLVAELGGTVSGVGVKTSYGEKVEIDGTTMVPVALGWYGFGGGAGEGNAAANDKVERGGNVDGSGSGSGGGGGGVSIPIGAYIGRGGDVRFEPNLVTLVVVATPVIWILGRSLAKLVKALKH